MWGRSEILSLVLQTSSKISHCSLGVGEPMKHYICWGVCILAKTAVGIWTNQLFRIKVQWTWCYCHDDPELGCCWNTFAAPYSLLGLGSLSRNVLGVCVHCADCGCPLSTNAPPPSVALWPQCSFLVVIADIITADFTEWVKLSHSARLLWLLMVSLELFWSSPGLWEGR